VWTGTHFFHVLGFGGSVHDRENEHPIVGFVERRIR
jgi:hypothetical protein